VAEDEIDKKELFNIIVLMFREVLVDFNNHYPAHLIASGNSN